MEISMTIFLVQSSSCKRNYLDKSCQVKSSLKKHKYKLKISQIQIVKIQAKIILMLSLKRLKKVSVTTKPILYKKS